MFENTFQKLKVCAYIFFIGNFLQLVYREVTQFIALGCPSQMIMGSLFSIVNAGILYFVIALFIYGFGKIVRYFENINSKNDFQK